MILWLQTETLSAILQIRAHQVRFDANQNARVPGERHTMARWPQA